MSRNNSETIAKQSGNNRAQDIVSGASFVVSEGFLSWRLRRHVSADTQGGSAAGRPDYTYYRWENGRNRPYSQRHMALPAGMLLTIVTVDEIAENLPI